MMWGIMKNGKGVTSVSLNNSFSDLHNPSFHAKAMQQHFFAYQHADKSFSDSLFFLNMPTNP